ncbi:hypothetical protein BH09MYX1_BH09MYX1_40770 [soil metagenome]
MRRRLLLALALLVVVGGCGEVAPPKLPGPVAAASPCRAAVKSSPELTKPTEAKPPATPSSSAALENLPITSVAVNGNHAMTTARVLSAAGLTVGSIYGRSAIVRAITSLYRSGEIDDVEVSAGASELGVAVELLVRERPFVGGIFAPDMDAAARNALASKLGLAEGRRFDLAELYLRVHAADAPTIDYEIVPKRDNQVDVCLYQRAP